MEPVLLIGLLFLFSGRKKGTTPGGGGNGNGNGGGSRPGAIPGVSGPPQQPVVPIPGPSVARPPGDPMGMDCGNGAYSMDFWTGREMIVAVFEELGYPVPKDRATMNALGPDGKIGGGDDVRSAAVAVFQDDYNAMSGQGLLGPVAGGLEVDGFVGPCTLNALENVVRVNGYNGDEWRTVVGTLFP